jgi:hypothetical protein
MEERALRSNVLCSAPRVPETTCHGVEILFLRLHNSQLPHLSLVNLYTFWEYRYS